MDKVRFAFGTNHVFQGFHEKGSPSGMVGENVWVTADTLRQILDHVEKDINTSDFDRQHNMWEEDYDKLAFGGTSAEPSIRLAPDGFTPLYNPAHVEATIVQRFDPTVGNYGVWVNESPIDDFEPWGERVSLELHGFTIDTERGSTPAILFDVDLRDEDEDEEPPIWVVDVFVPVSTVIKGGTQEDAREVALIRARQGALATLVDSAIQYSEDFVSSDSELQFEVGEGS